MPFVHINDKCPVTGNLSINNAIVNEYYVPSLMPTGQYRMDFEFFSNGHSVFEVQVFGSLVSQATQIKQVGTFDVKEAVFDTI